MMKLLILSTTLILSISSFRIPVTGTPKKIKQATATVVALAGATSPTSPFSQGTNTPISTTSKTGPAATTVNNPNQITTTTATIVKSTPNAIVTTTKNQGTWTAEWPTQMVKGRKLLATSTQGRATVTYNN